LELETFPVGWCLVDHLASRDERPRAYLPWGFSEIRRSSILRTESAFAIETKLGGRPNIGTISTTVVPTEEGRWNVKVDYLSPSAKRGWRSVSEDDWEEGDDWKEP
jgi:hypothetical protein